MTGATNFAHVAGVRQLAGRGLPIHQHIGQTVDAVARLETGTRSWRAFAPRGDALDAAITQADAVARSLRELRSALAAEGHVMKRERVNRVDARFLKTAFDSLKRDLSNPRLWMIFGKQIQRASFLCYIDGSMRDPLRVLLRNASDAQLHSMLDKAQLARWNELPEQLTLYRGITHPKAHDGLYWSPNRRCAEPYTRTKNGAHEFSRILIGQVNKNCLCHVNNLKVMSANVAILSEEVCDVVS